MTNLCDHWTQPNLEIQSVKISEPTQKHPDSVVKYDRSMYSYHITHPEQHTLNNSMVWTLQKQALKKLKQN